MEKSVQQIKLLLKGIYVLSSLLAVYVIAILAIYFIPPPSQSSAVKNSIVWKPKSLVTDVPKGTLGTKIKYGYQLITETSKLIGPLATNSAMRFAGNNLTCNNCHLSAGRKIGSGSFIGVMNRFPQFRGRENKIGTMEERINGCMVRSMNGKVLPENGNEMQAMIAYIQWLSDGVPKEVEKLYKGYVKINIPVYEADTVIGKEYYIDKCLFCHSENGSGKKKPGVEFTGYIYPPVGGNDTYNDGSGMNRIITSAEFI
ncbi:MAG: cytochrome C, partial [Flavobacteriaceae bacterium]|nr:cytochrome C [Flavobacteriaceae bacterium]